MLLLKGASLSEWLYPKPEQRYYLDCDLLVAPGDVESAEAILSSLGFAGHFDDHGMPDWWRGHAGAWVREHDGVTVDLHRTLPGIGVDPDVAWPILSRDTARVRVAGRDVPALSLPARGLHVALHAFQHGAGWDRPTDELDRAVATADTELWIAAAALAAELDATDAFAAGLRLTRAGRELAERLRLPEVRSARIVLQGGTPPPTALGFEQLARAGGTRARLAMAWRQLVPPAAYMRLSDPRAGNGRLALARAYLRRLGRLRHVPRGFAAWLAARRSVRRDDRAWP